MYTTSIFIHKQNKAIGKNMYTTSIFIHKQNKATKLEGHNWKVKISMSYWF